MDSTEQSIEEVFSSTKRQPEKLQKEDLRIHTSNGLHKKPKYKDNFDNTPIITSCQIAELRPTPNPKTLLQKVPGVLYMKRRDNENPHANKPWSKLIRSKSIEIRAGRVLVGCECHKHNGLQQDCPRFDCWENPTCSLPEPRCEPNAGYKPERPQTPGPLTTLKALKQEGLTKKVFCCSGKCHMGYD